MINIALCFMIGKAHGWGTFLKYKATFSNCLVLGPLFWECSHLRALPYTNDFESENQMEGIKKHNFYWMGKKHIAATSPAQALLFALLPFHYDWNLGSPLHGFLTIYLCTQSIWTKFLLEAIRASLFWALPFLGTSEIRVSFVSQRLQHVSPFWIIGWKRLKLHLGEYLREIARPFL
jgi:hypothetical protein